MASNVEIVEDHFKVLIDECPVKIVAYRLPVSSLHHDNVPNRQASPAQRAGILSGVSEENAFSRPLIASAIIF